MQPPHPSCESTLRRISASLDEGTSLTPEDQRHLANCEECSRFLDQWTGEIPEILSEPPPRVPLALRHRILGAATLPQPSLPPDHALPGGRLRLGRVAAAAAAVIAFASATWLLVDIQPRSDEVAKRTSALAAEQELAALKDDFRKGLLALREPVNRMHMHIPK